MGFINSIINISSQNIVSLFLFYFYLIIFAYPLGNYIKNKCLINTERFSFLFSISCGLSALSILYYLSILLKIPFSLFTVFLLAFNTHTIIVHLKKTLSKKKINADSRKIDFYSVITYAVFSFLFLYYLIPPLLIDYGFTRDYDIFALGIKQTGEFVLPFYNIENYYPPLVPSLTVFFSNLINVNINKLMMFIFPLVAFFIYGLFYLIGVINFQNKNMALSFLLAAMIIATLKNAVIGGSTYSFLLATNFFLLFIIFFFKYLETNNKSQLLFAGFFSGGILLSHADIFIVFSWFMLALFISRFAVIAKKKTFLDFSAVFFIIFLVASPYLYYALSNSHKVTDFWTEQMWIDKINGESRAKDISYISLFVGNISLILSLFGIITLYFIKIDKTIKLALFFFTGFLYIQNHQFIHYLVKPLLHIYPLNIIMWTGLTIPIVLLSGMGIYYLSTRIKQANIFFLVLFVFSLFVFLDYETFNLQNIYRGGSGSLIAGLSSRNTAVNSGDFAALEYLKQNNFSGKIMNMDNFAGYLAPVYTEKPSQVLFYEESYHDLTKLESVNKLVRESFELYEYQSPNKIKEIVDENNISLIYLPSTASLNSNKNLNYDKELLNKFDILYRKDGAKILNTEKTNNKQVVHLEAEDFIDTNDAKNSVQDYTYGKTIGIKTVKLPLNQQIKLKINNSYPGNISTNISTDTSTIHIKHLTFWQPLKIEIKIGNFTKEISQISDKLQFSESSIEIDNRLLTNPIEIIGINQEVKFFGKNIVPEIDWIEIETGDRTQR